MIYSFQDATIDVNFIMYSLSVKQITNISIFTIQTRCVKQVIRQCTKNQTLEVFKHSSQMHYRNKTAQGHNSDT